MYVVLFWGCLSSFTTFFLQDVSCNEISHLPIQIGDLKSLKSLNVRRNLLEILPVGKSSHFFNSSPHNPDCKWPQERNPFETTWEKEKMLVTSISPFLSKMLAVIRHSNHNSTSGYIHVHGFKHICIRTCMVPFAHPFQDCYITCIWHSCSP